MNGTESARALLEALLVKPAAELELRARNLFFSEAGRPYPCPLILVGAGQLGRAVLAGLRKVSVTPMAFADNAVHLHGTTVDGLPVLSPTEAVARFADVAAFVTTIYTSNPLRRQLRTLGVRPVSVRALFFQHASTFLPYLAIDTPATMRRDAQAILDGVGVWADDESLNEYIAQIEWHLLERDVMASGSGAANTYFPSDVFQFDDREVFVDCGAYDGDTIRSIVTRQRGKFGRIIALEPDSANADRLTRYVATLPSEIRNRIETHRIAAYSRRCSLRFDSAASVSSSLADAGATQIEAAPLDEILAGSSPTFIKMDIEGAEPEALAGAKRLLTSQQPKLAICLYHQRKHLWEIPLAIRGANPNYSLFLRRHSDECWETVCYARPNHAA